MLFLHRVTKENNANVLSDAEYTASLGNNIFQTMQFVQKEKRKFVLIAHHRLCVNYGQKE